MELVKLRAWLDRRLRKEVPDEIWDQLVADGYAKVGLDKIEREDLVVDARRLLRAFQAGAAAHGGRRPPGRVRLPEPPDTRELAVNLRDAETERARVFARLAAQMAAKHPDVIRFREDILDGHLLTDERARELLTEQGGLDGRGPIVQDLQSIAGRLSRDYRWREPDAMWFILTGHTPPVNPLRVTASLSLSQHGPDTATITLIVEPWINAKEVQMVYKDLQAQMRGKDNNRPLTPRRLRLVAFVEQHRQEIGGWRPLMDRWNEEYADPAYGDVRNFQAAYEDTYRLLMYPGYNMPNWRPYEPTPAQRYRKDYHDHLIAELSSKNAEEAEAPKSATDK